MHQLTEGVGAAKLSPRTVLVSYADFSRTTTYTSYFNLAKRLTDTTGLKFELFYDDLNNERFVSYGFPASYQTFVTEGRATYDFALSAWDGAVKAKSIVGSAYRYTDAHLRESFNSGIIAIDRRDLVNGPTATDIIASPFQNTPGDIAWPWELDVHSNIRDAGVFFTTDITVLDKLDVILGGRDDDYNVSLQRPRRALLRAAARPRRQVERHSTPSASATRRPFGLIPYYTYDQAAALELDQASDLQPGVIGEGGWLSDSYLSRKLA